MKKKSVTVVTGAAVVGIAAGALANASVLKNLFEPGKFQKFEKQDANEDYDYVSGDGEDLDLADQDNDSQGDGGEENQQYLKQTDTWSELQNDESGNAPGLGLANLSQGDQTGNVNGNAILFTDDPENASVGVADGSGIIKTDTSGTGETTTGGSTGENDANSSTKEDDNKTEDDRNDNNNGDSNGKGDTDDPKEPEESWEDGQLKKQDPVETEDGQLLGITAEITKDHYVLTEKFQAQDATVTATYLKKDGTKTTKELSYGGTNGYHVSLATEKTGTQMATFPGMPLKDEDGYVEGNGIFGASSYTFSMVSKAPDATAAGTADWLTSPQKEEENTYLQAESVYHVFVEATYEQVDPELETLIREQFFADTPADTMDFQEVTTQIRQVLRMQTCLNTAPASLPKGEDYLTWFLTEEQEGNAVAYAAAAVLAYRVAGDPARYVEGYHLAEQEKNDAVLTSQSAHAWAEVYVSGEGWLPVEVVPGMYTETYTNQMVEGKPAYQVGTSRQDDGLQAAEGTGNGSSKKEEPEEDKDLPGLLANIVLVILYGGFFLYLLLELQRAIRVQIRRRQKEMENGEIAEYYVNAFRELAAVAGVRTEEMTSSEQFFDAIRKHFPEVPERWYRRSMEILQRAKFGGKKLAPYEIYTLDCFEEKSHRMVYKK